MKYIEQFYDVNDHERNVINDFNQYKQNKMKSGTSQLLDIAKWIFNIYPTTLHGISHLSHEVT